MKTGKLIGIFVVIIILVIVAGYFIGKANTKKTAAAIATQPPVNSAVVGKTIANTVGVK